MVRKAKLDVLDNLPDIELIAGEIKTDNGEEMLAGPAGRWAINKLLLIIAPVLVVVLILSGSLVYYFSHSNKTASGHKSVVPVAASEKSRPAAGSVNPPAAVVTPQTSSETAVINKVSLNNFIIDLKDKTGKNKILMFDITLEVTGESLADLEARTDIRNMIYHTATEKNAVALRSLEERKKLKNELLQQASRILGAGIVKNLYFTNYVIM